MNRQPRRDSWVEMSYYQYDYNPKGTHERLADEYENYNILDPNDQVIRRKQQQQED